ncbi:enolase C-terminal domain-like protein [Microbacterium profundi]|uniref:Enolase C-terminal domain-like protein n=1 Tax=Microbacterium profundi TaxID=450380 RepID=A0ABV3LE98_9MICO
MSVAARPPLGRCPVVRLRVLRVLSPLVREFVTAVRRTDRIDVVLVEATDAAGRTGWGEAAVSWRVTGESPESVAAAVVGPLTEAVVGRDPGDAALPIALAGATWGNAAARSAVECALADLAARQQGRRLADVLFAASANASSPDGAVSSDAAPPRIRTDMTLSAGTPAELAATAAEHAAAGFHCLKVKADASMDLRAVLCAVSDAVGERVVLRVDANQAWEADAAIRSIRACEDAGLAIEFVEQPVAAVDLAALARVTAAVDTPIMADESVRGIRDVRAVADRGAADLVNIKLAKTGGLAEAQAAATAAVNAGLGVVFGCMMEAHVGLAAAAHLAAAVAPGVVHDLDAALWHRTAPVVGGIQYRADTIELGAGPGIGVTGLRSDALEEVLG